MTKPEIDNNLVRANSYKRYYSVPDGLGICPGLKNIKIYGFK